MEEIFHLINEMSPFLLLGFFIAGLMHAFIPGSYYSKYLARPTFRSVINAALLGIPIPLCSCGVIPTAMSLRREGASHGAVTSFLIATPQTGVDSILATYSLMGWAFAVIRPIAALFTALLGGALVNAGNANCGEESVSTLPHRSQEEKHSSLILKLKEAIKYAFVEMMGDIGKWLVIGLVVAGLITIFVPDSLFAVFQGNTWASMLLVLCIAIPMYVCATGSIPIAVALMLKGLTPGAALVLLMAGPACNAASILVVRKVLGRRTLFIYLISIILGAIGFGCLIDFLHFHGWVNFMGAFVQQDVCCQDASSWFGWSCTALLALLLLNALVLQRHHHCSDGCCCHHDEDDCCCHYEGQECHCYENDDHDDCCCHEGHCCHMDQEEEEPNNFISVSNKTNNTNNMTKYIVKGMNCSHCRAAAEKALKDVPGVTDARVDLASGEAIVEGNASYTQLKEAIDQVGFSLLCSE